jgi:asparagine synthase (glutamine-hydrolysing)
MTPDHLPYQVIGPEVQTPHASSVAMGALRSRLSRAAELGSDGHLVGEGGDVVVGSPPSHVADLAKRLELAMLWRACVGWARIRGRAPVTLLRRAVWLGATSRRSALRTLADVLDRGYPIGEETWESRSIGYWSQPHGHWLTNGARARLAAHARDTADHLTDDGLEVGDAVTLGQLRQQALTQQVIRATGAEFGIPVHAPFLDTEVVRTCLSLTARLRADPAAPKPLLCAALAGLVPETVLARRTKGDYTRDAHQGVRRAAVALRRMLSESVAADHGLIEPRPVQEALDGAIVGLPTPWGQLNQVFAVEVWLRRYEQGSLA